MKSNDGRSERENGDVNHEHENSQKKGISELDHETQLGRNESIFRTRTHSHLQNPLPSNLSFRLSIRRGKFYFCKFSRLKPLKLDVPIISQCRVLFNFHFFCFKMFSISSLRHKKCNKYNSIQGTIV